MWIIIVTALYFIPVGILELVVPQRMLKFSDNFTNKINTRIYGLLLCIYGNFMIFFGKSFVSKLWIYISAIFIIIAGIFYFASNPIDLNKLKKEAQVTDEDFSGMIKIEGFIKVVLGLMMLWSIRKLSI